MAEISTYRLTLIAGVVVLVLSVGLITVIAPSQSAQYITLVGTIAIPGLFALFRLEASAKQNELRHEENKETLGKLVIDNQVFGQALKQIKSSDMTIEEAALKASEVMESDTRSSGTAAD